MIERKKRRFVWCTLNGFSDDVNTDGGEMPDEKTTPVPADASFSSGSNYLIGKGLKSQNSAHK